MKETFNITGMTCSACENAVKNKVSKVDGVKNVNVSLLTNSMQVEYENTDAGKIIKAVQDAGYNAMTKNQKTSDKSASDQIDEETHKVKTRLIWSIIFTVPLFYISMGHMMGLPLPPFLSGHENIMSFAFTQFLLTIPVIALNFKYFRTGFKTLFHGKPNMDSLIAIGSSAALIYGIFAIYKIGIGLGTSNMDMVHSYSMDLYFESAAMILTLITLGKFLESRAKGKTSEAISKLIDMAPKTAIIEQNGQQIEVSAETLKKGDIIIVKPGSAVAVDGEIIEGSSYLDQSAITGESVPVKKEVGDKVIGASINKNGYFKFKAEKVGEDTAFSQIIRLVEEASSSKAPISRLADKISGIFVPIVIIIAIIATAVWLISGAGFEFSLSIGISVLVISCPCALGLATPTAIMVGTGKGAENGILFKDGTALEHCHKITTVVLDKTGTITKGIPEVTDIYTSDKTISDNYLLKLAASVEKFSSHPLAAAISDNYKEELFDVTDFGLIEGGGIKGTLKNEICLIGNKKLMDQNNIDISSLNEKYINLADEGKTPLFISKNKKLLGIIAVSDPVKETSQNAINTLDKMGINTVMLTGDNEKTAKAIKNKLGIKKFIADVLPQDKEKHVKELQSRKETVAMVGDGINDAPALASSDIGIAIGNGTDIAIESAQVVLMKGDLNDVPTAIKLSKKVILNIKENLFWAFIYNTIGIPVAAGLLYNGFGIKLSPMIAAAAMSFSSVCVVLNALRIKTFEVNNKRKDKKTMKKIIIEGMSCGHCSARVEKALNDVTGIKAKVNLEENTAYVELTAGVTDNILKQIVEDAGYKVKEII